MYYVKIIFSILDITKIRDRNEINHDKNSMIKTIITIHKHVCAKYSAQMIQINHNLYYITRDSAVIDTKQ